MADQIPDLVGEGVGLAGAGAGVDQAAIVVGEDRAALIGIELDELGIVGAALEVALVGVVAGLFFGFVGLGDGKAVTCEIEHAGTAQSFAAEIGAGDVAPGDVVGRRGWWIGERGRGGVSAGVGFR